MQRMRLTDLKQWYASSKRKPLVIRGARQVGKTWLARHFAESYNLQLIELNFEKASSYTSLFQTNHASEIFHNIEVKFNQKIIPEKSLLFLDEIQAAPEVISKLRWFAEEMPQLPIIAAGSLLEFVLEKHTFSMPVGRINYMHLEPFSFSEFLLASGKEVLFDYLHNFNWKTVIPESIHQELLNLFNEYLVVGGLPEAVSSWVNDKSVTLVHQIQQDILAAYLLNKTRICHRVDATAGNGIPMAAECNDKYFKEIYLDVGLCSASLGLTFNHQNLDLVNKGGIAEQVVGQLLRTLTPYYMEPQLFYWQRAEKGSNAEVDYLIAFENKIVPLEVKAGATGSMKSLLQFIEIKKSSLAVRVNADYPNKTNVNFKNSNAKAISYTLLSVPFYLLEQIFRLIMEHQTPHFLCNQAPKIKTEIMPKITES